MSLVSMDGHVRISAMSKYDQSHKYNNDSSAHNWKENGHCELLKSIHKVDFLHVQYIVK